MDITWQEHHTQVEANHNGVVYTLTHSAAIQKIKPRFGFCLFAMHWQPIINELGCFKAKRDIPLGNISSAMHHNRTARCEGDLKLPMSI